MGVAPGCAANRDPVRQAQSTLTGFIGTLGREPALSRKKLAVSGNCSEQDDGASGFAWIAREP
jgi:hypothetical protein